MMNEIEVWKYIKQAWLNPVFDNNFHKADFKGYLFKGICNSIDYMSYKCAFYKDVRLSINDKLDRFLPYPNKEGYSWSFSKRGAEARVRFCERMIKICEEEI